MKLDKAFLNMISEAGVVYVEFDGEGNVLKMRLGHKPGPMEEMEELAALTPEQLQKEAEKLLFAATEGMGS